MLKLCIILALAAGCAADGGIAYRGPPPVKEVFHLNDHISYYLYSDHVPFNEASAICKSNQGQLAVVDDSVKAGFLAQSIGDAWASLEDMWIGGQLVQNLWQWVGSQKKLPEIPRQAPNSTFLYPPWVDGATPLRKGRDCLAIDRNGHSDPYFIDLECKLPRPFVCETVNKEEADSPISVKTITIFDYEYILYHARVSWDGAVAFCRSQGYVLATLFNSTYAEKLAKAMLKTRPEFEDVWVGGSYKNEKWTWVENSEEIPMDPEPGAGDSNVLFPPWAHVPPSGGSEDAPNCVLFDRHLCEAPKFIDVKCNRLRDFVCARQVRDVATLVPQEDIITVRKKTFIIKHSPATFEDAQAICEDPKNPQGPGKLLYIDGGVVKDPYAELAVVMQLMSDTKDELSHVWLAAKYSETEGGGGAFKWIYETPNLLEGGEKNGQVLSKIADEATGYPPWCNNDEPSNEMPCLNLDRQNYNTPLYYGLECNVTQAVICVMEAVPKGVERFSTSKASYQSSQYNVTKERRKWGNAQKKCQDETGEMLTDVDDDELKAVAEHMPNGNYFIGAKYNPKKKAPAWVPSQTPINISTPIGPYKQGENCLYVKIEKKVAVGLEYVSCDEAQDFNYICADHCGDEIDEIKDHSWHCTWSEGQGVTEAYLGKACDKRCPLDNVLVGSRKITCQHHGWVGSRLGQPAECLAVDAAAKKLSEFIFASEPAGNDSSSNETAPASNGVLFIYDGAGAVTTDELMVVKYMIGATISKLDAKGGSRRRRSARGRRRALSRRRSSRSKRSAAGTTEAPAEDSSSAATEGDHEHSENAIVVPLINLNSDTPDPVILENAVVCDLIKSLEETPFDRGDGRRDYNKAFAEAKALLGSYNRQYTVVVISTGPNQGEDYRENIRGLKQIAKSVVTVGVGSRFNSEELADISTTDDNRVLQHVSLAEYGLFKTLGDGLEASGKCVQQLETLKSAASEAVTRIQDAKGNPPPEEPDSTDGPASEGASDNASGDSDSSASGTDGGDQSSSAEESSTEAGGDETSGSSESGDETTEAADASSAGSEEASSEEASSEEASSEEASSGDASETSADGGDASSADDSASSEAST